MANQEKTIVSEDTIPQTEVNEAFDAERDLACSAEAALTSHTDSENESGEATGKTDGPSGETLTEDKTQSDEEKTPKTRRRKKKTAEESESDTETVLSGPDAVKNEEMPKRKRTVRPKQNVILSLSVDYTHFHLHE